MAKKKQEAPKSQAKKSLMDDAKWVEHHSPEADFHTLMQAQEMQMDPDRMKAIMEHAKKKKGQIRSIEDLYEARNKVARKEKGEKEEDEKEM